MSGNGDYWDTPAAREVEREIAERIKELADLAARRAQTARDRARAEAVAAELVPLRAKLLRLRKAILAARITELEHTKDPEEARRLALEVEWMNEQLGRPADRYGL